MRQSARARSQDHRQGTARKRRKPGSKTGRARRRHARRRAARRESEKLPSASARAQSASRPRMSNGAILALANTSGYGRTRARGVLARLSPEHPQLQSRAGRPRGRGTDCAGTRRSTARSTSTASPVTDRNGRPRFRRGSEASARSPVRPSNSRRASLGSPVCRPRRCQALRPTVLDFQHVTNEPPTLLPVGRIDVAFAFRSFPSPSEKATGVACGRQAVLSAVRLMLATTWGREHAESGRGPPRSVTNARDQALPRDDPAAVSRPEEWLAQMAPAFCQSTG